MLLDLGLKRSLYGASSAPTALPDNGAVFDGSNDYLSQSVGGSQANSYYATFSFWMRIPTQASYGTDRIIGIGSATDFMSTVQAGIGLSVQAQTTGSTSLCRIAATGYDYFNVSVNLTANTAYSLARDTWYHIYIVVDSFNLVGRCFINNVEDSTFATAAFNDVIEFATGTGLNGVGRWHGSTAAANYLNGALYQPWVSLNYYNPATYASQFYNGGAPPSLGADGSLITGSQPLIYLNSEPASFQTNAGFGGNFTLTGALTTIAAP